MLLAKHAQRDNKAGKQSTGTPTPSIPPPHRPKEGLPIDPDLLSPHLNRLRIDLS